LGCNRTRLLNLSKYRKKYSLVRQIPKFTYVSNTTPEIENIIVDVPVLTDTVTVLFDSPFTGEPNVVANFISFGNYGNVNVYILSVSTTSVVIKTSVPVTGKIAVQAMYIDGCGPMTVSPAASAPFVIYVDTSIQTPIYGIPLNPTSAINEYRFMGIGTFDIDWGDGNFQTGVTGSPGTGILHTYASPGQYEITVSNWTDAGNGIAVQTYDLGALSIDGDCIKLLEIRSWGSAVWTSMEGAFSVCENMIGTFSDVPNLSACSSLSHLFFACTSFNTDISGWNTSNITDMSNLFQDASTFNQPLNAWNVSSVTSMNEMFSATQTFMTFNQPLNSWNVSSVTDMDGLFYFNGSFDQELSSWILNNTVSMDFMLSNSGISANNYSQTLVGWANEAYTSGNPINRSLGAAGMVYNNQVFAGSPYTSAAGIDAGGPAGARDFLVTTKGWTIIGDSP